MLKKFISIVLMIALVNLSGIVSAFAKSNTEKELRIAAKVKENIEKLGTGEKAKVKITLKDKTKIEGCVSEVQEDSFTVTDSKTGQETKVEYSQVKKVKGNNLSTGVRIAIGVGIGLAILVIAVLAKGKVCSNALCQ
jgi:hypothetical protein